MLPDAARAIITALNGDVRLETLIPMLQGLPSATPRFNERAAELLRQIREEVGDAWSPRDKGETPEDAGGGGQHVHFHGKDAVEAALEGLRRVQEMTPEQVVAACEQEAVELARKAKGGKS